MPLFAQETPTPATRIAAAKLLETSGDLQQALVELEQALAGASEADRTAIQQQQARLRQRMGRASVDSAQGPVNADPLQRQIHVLNTASRRDPGVAEAMADLESLGALAVPALVAALPKLGPYGLGNALSVLRSSSDVRVVPALQSLLRDSDPAVVLAVAQELPSLRREVALPVATVLATQELAADTMFAVFEAMRRHAPADAATLDLATRLAAQPGLQQRLFDAVGREVGAAADAVRTALMKAAGPLQAPATVAWIARHPERSEADVLALIMALVPAQRPAAARSALQRNPDWLEVGRIALAGIVEHDESVREAWFVDGAWQRRPDEVARVLLALPLRPGSQAAQGAASVCAGLVENGWQPAAQQHEDLERLMLWGYGNDVTRAFVRSIPAAAEDRALATWQRLDPPRRVTFVVTAVELERPWHRLVAQQLAACDRSTEVPNKLLLRDWTGAPAEAVAALVALVERFPAGQDGRELPWHSAVSEAYLRCMDLPAAFVLPLVRRGSAREFAALAHRHPAEALAYARATPTLTLRPENGLDRLIRDHGTAADVPLAVRLVLGTLGATSYPLIEEFLRRCGRGRVEVVGLARASDRLDVVRPDSLTRVALAAAAGLSIADLAQVVEILPGLDDNVRYAVTEAIRPQVRAEHAAQLAAALRAQCTMSAPDVHAVEVFADWLAAARNPACLPVLRQLLTADERLADLVDPIAATMLAAAGDERRAVVDELLASPLPSVVAVVVAQADVRADATLRSKVTDAVLRVGAEARFDDALFAGVAPEHAAALAAAVLGDARLHTFSEGLCNAALKAARRTRPGGDLVALLARCTAHPEADVRACAAQELGNLFQREAAPHLLELLKDEHPNVRKHAETSLAQLANYLDARKDWEQRLK